MNRTGLSIGWGIAGLVLCGGLIRGSVLAAAAVDPPSAAAPVPFVVEGLTKSMVLRAGQILRVVNRFGDIRAKPADGETLVLSAMIQLIGPTPRRPTVAITAEPGGVAIEVVYPDADEAAAADPVAFGGRTDLAVLVPAGATLKAHTGRGAIKLAGLRGDIEAESGAGNISIRAAGHVQATTVGGAISVRLTGARLERPLGLRSTAGPISVTLPADLPLTIRAQSGAGRPTTTWAADTAAVRADPDGSLEAQVAGGGPLLRIDSASGPISLATYQRPHPHYASGVPAPFTRDLRTLTPADPWQPGDPIAEGSPRVHPSHPASPSVEEAP